MTEVLRLLHGREIHACVIGVSTVQEEIGLRGAIASAFSCEADVGVLREARRRSRSHAIIRAILVKNGLANFGFTLIKLFE